MDRAKYIITSNHLNEVRHEIVDGIKDLLLKVKNGHLEISSNRVPNPIVAFPTGMRIVHAVYREHKGTGDLVIECQPVSDHLGRVLFITENKLGIIPTDTLIDIYDKLIQSTEVSF